MNFMTKTGIAGIVGVGIALLAASSCLVWNEPDQVVVLSQFGAVKDEILSRPGYHYKDPRDSAIHLPRHVIKHRTKAAAATSKGQSAPAEIAVAYFVNPEWWPKVYQRIGGVSAIDRALLDNNVQQSLKAVTGSYLGEQLIWDREEIKAAVVQQLQASIDSALEEKGLKGAIKINSVAITSFNFSADFNDAINKKVEAEQRALQAQSEADQKAILAKSSADARNLRTDASAYAAQVVSVAKAEGIALKVEALKQAKGLVELRRAEAWKGKLPRYHGEGQLPFVGGDKK